MDQFHNEDGLNIHEQTLGPEIWKQTNGKVNAFCTSIGSGGTFAGVARYLKRKNPAIKCIAVEPRDGAILSKGYVKNPAHMIQGTGYGIVPPHWDPSLCDEIITVSDKEAREMTIRLSHEEGTYVGYSSGANVNAAMKYLNREMNNKINMVTILCDVAYKYSDL